MKDKKVILIYKVFNHYRKSIFDELATKVSFIMLHSKNENWVKSENSTYSIQVPSLYYGKKPTQVWLFVLKKLISISPDVIIHEFTPSLISLHTSYIYAKLFRKKYIIYGHGYNKSKPFNKSSLIIKIRFYYFRNSDAIILYGQQDKEFLANYLDKRKLFVAQNTLDTDYLSKIRNSLDDIGKFKLQDELNFHHKYNIIFIGRLLKDKYPEILIKLAILFREEKIDVGFHYIGDGDMKSTLVEECLKNSLDNVYFHGEIHDNELSGKYLFISDLMVMPGCLGLSVNHALCFDCPVVSYEQGPNGPFHGPEIEYVINNKTGYLAKTNDVNDMKEWISSYLVDISLQKTMKLEIRNAVINVFSKDKMVKGFIEAIDFSMTK